MEKYQFDSIEQHLLKAEYHLKQAGRLADRFGVSVQTRKHIMSARVKKQDSLDALRRDRKEKEL